MKLLLTPLLTAVIAITALPPTPAAASSPVGVRIASYNAWLLPIAASELNRRKRAIPSAIAAEKPDVVCFQEVWLRGHQKELAWSLRKQLPHAAYGAGGLMVLSRFPIGRSDFYPVPVHQELPLTEKIAGKGWLEVDIGTPAGPVRVVNSHLALDLSARRLGHKQQLKALATGLGSGSPDHATLLCADLNMRGFTAQGSPTRALDRFLRLGFSIANAFPRQPTRIGWPRPKVVRRWWAPDFVMARSGKRVLATIKAFRRALHTRQKALSDHDLIVVDAELTRAP